jgi:primary-amine oxidase
MQTLDEGIFGLGYLSMPVQAGQQVPSNAVTLGAVMPDSTLLQFSQLFADRIYVYERDGGTLINYRERGRTVYARAPELVIGSMVSLGNYVYGLNWVFKQDGSFAFEAELSGSIVTKFAVAKECETCAAIAQGIDGNGESRSYESSGSEKNGTLVYPNAIGINHQHWFNLRLDFDIDGPRNAVMENNVKRTAASRTNGATLENSAAIEVVHTVFGSAAKAKRHMNHDTSRTWTIYNPSARNASLRPAGYTLMPMDNTATVLGPSLERGPLAFVFHHMWLTPQRDGQLYAAGAYPNQAKSTYDDTLYSYADGSSVYDADIVVWYSLGHTHVPRPEDFPLMTTRKLSVVFQPDGFFERNAVFGPR